MIRWFRVRAFTGEALSGGAFAATVRSGEESGARLLFEPDDDGPDEPYCSVLDMGPGQPSSSCSFRFGGVVHYYVVDGLGALWARRDPARDT